jgi:anti-anti-sigma factor
MWTAARLARRLARAPGFRGLRVFRRERAAEALLVLSEWEGWEALAAVEADVPIARLIDPLRERCSHWRQRRLEVVFQLELPRRFPSAALAQGLQFEAGQLADATSRQKTFGLKAMSLPGTIGVLGSRCTQDAGYFFCAVEFETEAARQEFLGSAAWHEWTRAGVSSLWRKEPRLDMRGVASGLIERAKEQRCEKVGSLGVHIDSSPDGATVFLRLSGRLDDSAAERLERVREALVAGGCRTLTLDVTDLDAASPTGLKTLLEAARQVKSAGGQFSLVDCQGRYDRILRVWHLNQALAAPPMARRRPRPVRLPSPGKA